MEQETYYVDINLGNECNFRCTYCFESMDEKRTGSITDKAVKGVFRFIDNMLSSTSNKIHIDFWGGEPFIHFNRMTEIMDRYLNEPRIKFLVYTNGFYLKDHIEELEKYKRNLGIQVSYDFEPVNTLRRVDANNTAYSEKTREAIHELDDRHFNYSIKSTMTWSDMQYHLSEVYEYFYRFANTLGNPNVSLGITPDNTGVGGDIIDPKLIGNQMYKMITFMAKHNITDPRFNWFRFPSAKAVCHSVKVGCLIDIDGSMYPCHGCSYMPEDKKKNYVFGNVSDFNAFDKFVAFISKDISLEAEKCKTCNTLVCFRCNAINSLNNTADMSSWDAPNDEMSCKLYKEISKYIWVYRKFILK